MPRFNYTAAQCLELIVLYGECNRHFERTCDAFIAKFPNLRRPSRQFLRQTLHNCETYGSFKAKMTKEKPLLNNENVNIDVMAYFTQNPNASIREAARELDLSKSMIHNILKKNKWQPFKYQTVQAILPGDSVLRANFCEFILIKSQEDENFNRNIIWCDESKFCRNGMFNKHNVHYWADQQPHIVRETRFQDSWSFNAFCCIKDNKILGIHFYDENLNSDYFNNILRIHVFEWLHEMNIEERRNAWFQMDGAPAHNSRVVYNTLNNMFADRWFGANGPHRWPPRSPDITPMDFFFWGFIKNTVYNEPVTTKNDLKQRIRQACASLSEEQIRNATSRNFSNRVLKCLEQNGGHFEHLL